MTTSLAASPHNRWRMAPERAVLLSRVINIIALFGLIGVLAGSLHLQFGVGEQPCPLCIVQRSGMVGLAVGPIMNLLWGIRARHYALSILAAVVGAAGSTRQILLHIADPADPGYGPEVFGWHLYTWALVTFIVAIVGCALLIMWQAPFEAGDRGVLHDAAPLRPLVAGLIVWLSLLVIIWVFIDLLAIGIYIVPECGLGECPDDPANTAGLPEPWGWIAVLSAGVVAAVVAAVLERRWKARESAA